MHLLAFFFFECFFVPYAFTFHADLHWMPWKCYIFNPKFSRHFSYLFVSKALFFQNSIDTWIWKSLWIEYWVLMDYGSIVCGPWVFSNMIFRGTSFLGRDMLSNLEYSGMESPKGGPQWFGLDKGKCMVGPLHVWPMTLNRPLNSKSWLHCWILISPE